MITKLLNRFKKKPSKPLFNKNDRIRLLENYEAKKLYTAIKCTVEKTGMLLFYQGENENRVFFLVRCCFDTKRTGSEIARDLDEVFFDKEDFKNMKYKLDNKI